MNKIKLPLKITQFLKVALLIVITLVGLSINSLLVSGQGTLTFNFDNGSPTLSEGRSTPFSQTVGATTAYFSSPSDPAAFSVQSYGTTFFRLSQFSGKYLYDNKPSRDILDIKFSALIVAVRLTFATIESNEGVATVPSKILLIAYANTNLVGSTTEYGSFSSDSYPQGTLSLSSGQPFNWVRISVPAQTSGTTDFLIDNITVTVISESPTP